MCYRKGLSKEAEQLKVKFGIEIATPETYVPKFEVNGYTYPEWPIFTNENTKELITGTWGLIPKWGASDIPGFRKKTNTLNAMIETITEKPTYKSYTEHRCLIPVDRFFEWKHIGKEKLKHNIYIPDENIFCLAGIYSLINEHVYYTVLTTQANTLMANIHNTKKRMPVVLHKDEHQLWLSGDKLNNFYDRSEINLVAKPMYDESFPLILDL